MKRDPMHLRLFFMLALVAGAAVIALLISLFILANRVDANSRAREQSLVANGVKVRTLEVQRSIEAVTPWDDAVQRLDNRFDLKWAQKNVGAFFSQTAGLEVAYVLDHADHSVYGMENGVDTPAKNFRTFAAAVAPLVRQVREEERARGRFKRRSASDTVIAHSIQASALQNVGGQSYILTASLVQPDFGAALPKRATAPILITGEALDKNFMTMFAQRFMLRDLKLDPAHAPENRANIALNDGEGRKIGMLTWNQQRPGQRLLMKALAPIMFVVILLGGGAAILFLQARKTAHGLIASEARATHMALHDGLTGLANRTLFADRLGHALEQLRRNPGAPVAVHCLDLDRFKEVNDTYGHQCGDELLRDAAQRLSKIVRTSDTLARLGGDEFAIVQMDATGTAAASLAERILAALVGPVELSGGRAFMSCSVGIAMIGEAGIDGGEALRRADLALYRAKEAGRGQYSFFEPEMDSALKMRKAIEADLREAVANNNLHMFYQPQVDRRGVMTGVEALVRWNHPERGAVAPSFFIPMAEECGLIDEIGRFTLHQAFTDSARWPNLKIAINVSAHQLRRADFSDMVAELLLETGVNARQFELELTEGVLLGDDQTTHETLDKLRAMGFVLALDDFGTGYSSLGYLRRYPVDKIKIDRCFITGLGVDSEADSVIKAIVRLARALNLSVIAEGVETQDQRDRLAAVGCDMVQGFLYSKPVAAQDIDELLASRLDRAGDITSAA